jgi:hypothetical protein
VGQLDTIGLGHRTQIKIISIEGPAPAARFKLQMTLVAVERGLRDAAILVPVGEVRDWPIQSTETVGRAAAAARSGAHTPPMPKKQLGVNPSNFN